MVHTRAWEIYHLEYSLQNPPASMACGGRGFLEPVVEPTIALLEGKKMQYVNGHEFVARVDEDCWPNTTDAYFSLRF